MWFTTDKPENDNWRFEYKYRLSIQQYYRVKAAIRPFVQADAFTSNAPRGGYLVRSLYYDSADMRAYQEKVDGDCDRTKLRIRTYTNNPLKKANYRVEMKTRKGVYSEKYSSFISPAWYESFLLNNHWPANSDPLLIEFERYIHLKTLLPLVLIEYQREGFNARAQPGLRITFDHQVQSTKADTLFPETSFFHKHYRGNIIFEIKCDKNQPAWLHELVQTQGLRIAANSKFTQGIELSRPELVRPEWSY